MRHKKITFLLILSIIAAGCFGIVNSPIVARVRNRMHLQPVSSNDGHYALGSIEYVDNIQQIIKTAGYNAALHKVMADVGKNGSDIDTNDYSSNLRLYKLVSSLVDKVGYVDEDVHYFRNKLNREPKTLKDLLKINSHLPPYKRWRLLPAVGSVYHLQGKDGIYNLKFLSADGFCEAVYNKDGMLLDEKNDPINMGTFNYAAGVSGIGEAYAHEKYDIDPYLKWGNTPDSPQKGAKAIYAGIKKAEQEYNQHSTSVEAYRTQVLNSYKVKKSKRLI